MFFNPFKKTVREIAAGKAAIPASIPVDTDKELSKAQKKRLFQQTKMYILVQDVIKSIEKNDLHEGETIEGFLPFSNEENSAMATAGILGMAYTRTSESKEYRDTFNNLRGNRIMLFTNERMIFFVVIEYLDEHLFYSYPYENIQHIRFEEHKSMYYAKVKKNDKAKFEKRDTYYYTLDFQAKDHVFTEMLTEADARTYKQMREKIPAFAKIDQSEKLKRETKFDYVLSSTKIWGRIFVGFWAILAIAVFGIIILGLFGIGPYAGMF